MCSILVIKTLDSELDPDPPLGKMLDQDQDPDPYPDPQLRKKLDQDQDQDRDPYPDPHSINAYPQPLSLGDVGVPLLQLFLEPGGALLHGLELGGEPLHVGLHLGEQLVALREEGGVRVHQAGERVQHHVLLTRLHVGSFFNVWLKKFKSKD
jgi:hypothetical protein